MTINGYEYSQTEIFEALRCLGYTLLKYSYPDTDTTFPGGTQTFRVDTHCAVKGTQIPSRENTWDIVALKEFQKPDVKPPLL